MLLVGEDQRGELHVGALPAVLDAGVHAVPGTAAHVAVKASVEGAVVDNWHWRFQRDGKRKSKKRKVSIEMKMLTLKLLKPIEKIR